MTRAVKCIKLLQLKFNLLRHGTVDNAFWRHRCLMSKPHLRYVAVHICESLIELTREAKQSKESGTCCVYSKRARRTMSIKHENSRTLKQENPIQDDWKWSGFEGQRGMKIFIQELETRQIWGTKYPALQFFSNRKPPTLQKPVITRGHTTCLTRIATLTFSWHLGWNKRINK